MFFDTGSLHAGVGQKLRKLVKLGMTECLNFFEFLNLPGSAKPYEKTN